MYPEPQIVRDWSTAPDGLSWRFTLRPSLRFHDGQPVTTAGIIPALQRLMTRDVVCRKLPPKGMREVVRLLALAALKPPVRLRHAVPLWWPVSGCPVIKTCRQ